MTITYVLPFNGKSRRRLATQSHKNLSLRRVQPFHCVALVRWLRQVILILYDVAGRVWGWWINVMETLSCCLPHGMIIHHDVEQQEQMMNATKAIVKVLTHLTRWKRPNDDQACHHCPAGKADWCQERQAQNILLSMRMINRFGLIRGRRSLTSFSSFAQLSFEVFAS